MSIIKHDFQKKRQETSEPEKKEKKIPGYVLHIELGFSSPLITRTVKVPGRLTLAAFHSVIQTCFDWHDEATHRFLVGKIFYNPASAIRGDNDYCEEDVQLHQLEEGMAFIFTYLYEGGSGWECEISVVDKISDSKDLKYPELLEAERALPGSLFTDIQEYQALLIQLQEEKDAKVLERYELATDFDPDLCDIQSINEHLRNIV